MDVLFRGCIKMCPALSLILLNLLGSGLTMHYNRRESVRLEDGMDHKQFMNLWNKGKSLHDYFEENDPRLMELRERVLTYSVSDAAIKEITALKDDVRVLVFSEPWCPDCVINLTVLELMAEHSHNLSVKVLGKEGHEALISSFNTERKAFIPTFLIFVNDKLTGVFVEQPEVLKQLLLDGSQKDRIVAMQDYRSGKYADATAEELLEYIKIKG